MRLSYARSSLWRHQLGHSRNIAACTTQRVLLHTSIVKRVCMSVVLSVTIASSVAFVIQPCGLREVRLRRAAVTIEDASSTEATAALQRGIQVAADKGLLPAAVEVEPVRSIDLAVIGADAAAAEIAAAVGTGDSSNAADGTVIIVQAPPGVDSAAVSQVLQQKLPRAEVWPVRTFFKAMTFLLLTLAEQTGSSMKELLQRPEMLAAGIEMIDEMREGKSLGALASQAEGMMAMSSDVQKVTEQLPLAFEFGQGEVINFVQAALPKAIGDGKTIVVEGPEEVLRHIRTPYRFQVSG